MGTLSDWNDFFETNRRPNFGDLHTKYGQPEFALEYYCSETLKDFQHRLFDTLTGEFEMLNMLITGHPGIGKTTFLYYLKHLFEADPDRKHVIKIFHSSRATGFTSEKEAEERIQEEIELAWEYLYKSCAQEGTFSAIKSSNHSLRKRLNELSDYYLRNKGRFNKILVFAVDDVDLLSKNELHQIVKFVIKNIEAKSVKKWFFVRPQTYNEYDEDTKALLQGFFPDVRNLPKTRLYDLVQHRIRAISKANAPKCPFSPHLCSYIEEIVGGDHRQALPTLEHILCEVPPPSSEKQSEEFVRNHIDRVAIRSLVGRKLIPDIHSPEFRTISQPIPIDIIGFLYYTADLAILKACIAESLQERASRASSQNPNLRKYKAGGTTPVHPYPRDVDINYSLEKLQKAQVIEKQGAALKLTRLGKVLAIFSGQPYFLEESITSSDPTSIDYDSDYLKYASVKIDHQKIVIPYILRSF